MHEPRSRAKRLRSAVLWWAGILLAVLIWHLVARSQPAYVLPGPGATWEALVDLVDRGRLGDALVLTAGRGATGLGLSCLVGIPLGWAMGNYLFGDAGSGEDGDITRLAVMFALCITLFFFVLECVMKRHFPAYLLTFAVLLLSPAAGIIPDMAAVGCILVFQTVFFAFGAGKPKSRRRALSSQPKLSAVKNGTIVSGIALAALIFASVSVSGHAGVFYGAVDRAEGAVLTYVRDVTGRSEQIDTGGSISYGNNYRSGTKLFTVSVNIQPDRTTDRKSVV